MLGSFFRLLNQFWSDRKSTCRPVKPRRRTQLSLESLEERAVPAVIGGYIYYDQNNNGIFDSSETGIANQAVELENAAGNVLSTTTTNSNGEYQFATNQQINTSPVTITQNLTFGNSTTGNSQTQTINQFNSSLGTLTSVEILENGTLTSDIKIESTDDAPSTVQATVSGTLNLEIPGENTLVAQATGAPVSTNVSAFDGTIDFAGTSGHDFGNQTASGSTSETLEANQTSLSPFIGTGTISLTELAKSTSSASGPGNLVSTITSQSAAKVTVIYQYTPSNALTPGNYKVVEVKVPTGYVPGLLTNNNVTPIPNSVGQNTIPVTLTNTNSNENNFGNLLAGSLQGYVYHDANDNGVKDSGELGIAGVQIELTGTNDLGKTVTATQTTGQGGSYDFTGLRPGTYTITKENTPQGYIDGKDTIGSQGGTVGTNQFTQVVLNVGQQGTSNNFGEFKSSSLSGYEYVDANNNGIMDANEKGIANVRILLTGTDMNGNQVNLATTTNSTGFYQFNNLLAGDYTIRQIPPVGYKDGKLTIGSLGGTTAQDAFMVQVGLEQAGTNYNFGHPTPPKPVNPTNPPVTPLDPNGPPTMSKYWLIF